MQRNSDAKCSIFMNIFCANTAPIILHLEVYNFVGMLMDVISRKACLKFSI